MTLRDLWTVKPGHRNLYVRRAVDNAVLTVQKRTHDAFLTAMDEVVIPRFEMTMKSVAGSSGHWPNSEVQNPDPRFFLGNAGNTPLITGSGRLDLNRNQDRNDETRNGKNFEDGDFSALRPIYDPRAQVHRCCDSFLITFWRKAKLVNLLECFGIKTIQIHIRASISVHLFACIKLSFPGWRRLLLEILLRSQSFFNL